jgi:transcriptional regulator with XRE-family HTH domain
VGSQVRALRQQARLTQKGLAERANVSLSSLQSLELGHGSSMATLVRVVRSLNRTDWLESLAPSQPTISPREQWQSAQQKLRRQVKRVRTHSGAAT